MKLNTIIVALSAVALIIGIDQSLKVGFFESYWLFMSAGLLFLWYQFRKNRLAKEKISLQKKANTNSKNKKKKKRAKR